MPFRWVLQHTEQPVVLLVSFLALPNRRDAPHGTAFAEEVKDKQVAVLQVLHHFRTWVLGPALHHPDGFRVDLLHRIHYRLTGFIEINFSGIL